MDATKSKLSPSSNESEVRFNVICFTKISDVEDAELEEGSEEDWLLLLLEEETLEEVGFEGLLFVFALDEGLLDPQPDSSKGRRERERMVIRFIIGLFLFTEIIAFSAIEN